MKTSEKRQKRCLACKGKQASHKCYTSWVETDREADVHTVYTCSCPKCQPPVTSLRGLLP